CQDIIDPSHMAESIWELMKPRRVSGVACDLDSATLANLASMRSEILDLYAQPGGAIAVQKSQLVNLSPKEILDLTDSFFAQLHSLVACLEAMIEKTEDVEYCQRLRLHKAVERALKVMRSFPSNREIVFRGLHLVSNLTTHDGPCVDAIIENSMAPDIMLSLDNFPGDQEMQVLGCRVLRRVYLRAREVTMAGCRVVTLGKQLDEVWTFHGLSRVLTSMKLFQENAEIQLECCVLLASIAELLYNNGYATEVFRILEVAIRKHAEHAGILCQIILIIARLGSSFLNHEPRGVRTIVEAMARHRSDRELQKTAVRALFTLAKDELALQACRAGGGTGAIFYAMAAHPDEAQVLQEGARALEKHCPRAVASIFRVCDLAMLLPLANWSTGPGRGTMQAPLEVEDLKSGGWNPRGIENFLVEFSPPSENTGTDEDQLHLHAGFRKQKALRDDLDAADKLWMSVGRPKVSMPRSTGHNIRQKDMNALAAKGCDVDVLRQSGPKREQVRRFCEVLGEAIAKKFSAQDGELLVLLLGHFAWFSHSHAREITEFQGHVAIMEWLRSERFKGQSDPKDDALAFPLHGACLSALGCICRHGIDTAGHLLDLDALDVALHFAGHLEASVRVSALRLLARLIPYAAQRQPGKEALPSDVLWPLILQELKGDEVLRTAAAACALEGIVNNCVPAEGPVAQQLTLELLRALDSATQRDAPAAALPVLIAVNRLASEDDEALSGAVRRHEALVSLLTAWLPRATQARATSCAKAAGLAAANTLRLLSDTGAALDGGQLAPLLRCGTSVLAEVKLQDACRAAIESAVQREQDAGLLVQMLMGRLNRESGEKIADVSVMMRIAQRAISILKQDPSQATEPLLEVLEGSDQLVPAEVPDAKDMQAVLQELQEVTARSLALAAGIEDEDGAETTPMNALSLSPPLSPNATFASPPLTPKLPSLGAALA
ncbi:unnamed protein product, partial [Effrenium voratum]